MKRFAVITMVFAVALMIGGPAYADLADGLVAYYPFNGNAEDESGNGHHGTLLPAVDGPTPIEDCLGNPNSAFSFDGVDDYVDIIDSELLDITAKLTMVCWIKTSEDFLEFVEVIDNIETSDGYGLFIDADEKAFVTLNGGFAWVTASTSINNGSWHQVAGTYDGSEVRIYVDGKLENNVPYSSPLDYSPNPNFVIGKWDQGGREFKGLIDEVRIYNRVLSEAEIQQLYESYCPQEPCNCPDTDGDGVPDAWDECPNTPEGSCVYSNGCPCPAAIPLFICALEPNVANPGDVIKIFGSGFGSMQGDSILHIGDETFDQNSSNIQLWSDCKLEFMVSEHECNWWGLQDYREEDVWVTVNDEDSNKKTLKIIRPKDCAFCSDNLWNIRVNAEDFFHSNEAWVRPWRGSTDDGWGRFRGGYGYEFQWHHGPYTQPSGSVSSTLSWTINGQGKLKVAGTRDHQWQAWTYVYVSAPKTLEIPFAKGNGTCVPRFFVNEDFDTPYQYIDKTYVTLHLVAGWNRIDISGYNQNDNFNFDLNYNLAKNVDRMNSTECTTDNGCICPTVYQPVCGVDGNTYSNGCYAACAGVDVAYSGECTP